MRRTIAAVASLAVFLTVSAAGAQMKPTTPTQSPAQSTQGHSPGGHAPGHHSQQPMMGHMGQGQGHMGHGMMGMCPMMGMGGMMGGGMMGGMMGSADPKAQARMLKLRGDMMKAMGDVLLKHAQEVEQGK